MHFIRNLFSRSRHGLRNGRYGDLKIALVADELTRSALEQECRIYNLTPSNYLSVLKKWKPDLVFVESAWQGYRNNWKYGLATYPSHPDRTNEALKCLVTAAEDAGIPSVFWNKEDSTHYDRFIETAKLFKNVFTVDANCIEKYKRDLSTYDNVATLMFPVQPRFHFPLIEFGPSKGFSCFIGSYSRHIHARRRFWQNMLFETLAPYGLDIYDRNHRRKSENYRYPLISGMRVRRGVNYRQTADIYRGYKINLNVNTVEDSPTMYSRRLIEILAVGGVAISTPSIAVSKLFSDYCYIVNSYDDLLECVENLRTSAFDTARQRALEGARVIAQRHTWENRLMHMEDLSVF